MPEAVDLIKQLCHKDPRQRLGGRCVRAASQQWRLFAGECACSWSGGCGAICLLFFLFFLLFTMLHWIMHINIAAANFRAIICFKCSTAPLSDPEEPTTSARILSLPVLIGRSCIAGDGCLMHCLFPRAHHISVPPDECAHHFHPSRARRLAKYFLTKRS